jgi:hypothetical protein
MPEAGLSFHTHFSPLHALQSFLAVVIIGTVWRLLALHMVRSKNPLVHAAGKAMTFQY